MHANRNASRGTAKALTFSCYESEEERTAADTAISQKGSGNSSNVAIGKSWAIASTFVDLCKARAEEEGRLISTAFVARDLMQVVDALGEDGLLRYWGMLQPNPAIALSGN